MFQTFSQNISHFAQFLVRDFSLQCMSEKLKSSESRAFSARFVASRFKDCEGINGMMLQLQKLQIGKRALLMARWRFRSGHRSLGNLRRGCLMVLCHEDCIVPIVKVLQVLRKFKNQGIKTPLLPSNTAPPHKTQESTTPENTEATGTFALFHFWTLLAIWSRRLDQAKSLKRRKRRERRTNKRRQRHTWHTRRWRNTLK